MANKKIIINKNELVRLREEENLIFREIAKKLNCSHQATNYLYYCAKIKEFLPMKIQLNDEIFELNTISNVKRAAKKIGMTFTEFVKMRIKEKAKIIKK